MFIEKVEQEQILKLLLFIENVLVSLAKYFCVYIRRKDNNQCSQATILLSYTTFSFQKIEKMILS